TRSYGRFFQRGVAPAGQLRHLLVRQSLSCAGCCRVRCGLRWLGLMSDVSGLLGIHGDVSCSFVVESGWGSQRPTVEGCTPKCLAMRLFDQPCSRSPAATVRRSCSPGSARIAGASSVDCGIVVLRKLGTGPHVASSWSPSILASSKSFRADVSAAGELFGEIGRVRMTVR